ncbi:MAG: anaerobic ribonucleoside-triphosphate reductase activating protein [Sulfuricurvum sp.]|nr:anaerobic ribonucleoside-triphosphate reductase activating protein [Sulfuricurvum sp.]
MSAQRATSMKALYDLTPFTLLDFPDIPAAIFWFAGCNLRCVYCYNPELVFGEAHIDEAQALVFLEKRRGLLEGVVLSGGECTLYPNLIPFCITIKAFGYKIKLDTNGMRPDVIASLIALELVDYVALDYKAPDAKMAQICGGGSEKRFWESFELLHTGTIAYEVRTTLHPDFLSDEEIVAMAKALKDKGYGREFYVQLFQEGRGTLGHLSSSSRRIDAESLAAYVTLRR